MRRKIFFEITLAAMLLNMQVLFPALMTAEGTATTQTSPQAKSLLLESDFATNAGNISNHSDDYGLRAREGGADKQPNGDFLSTILDPCVLGGLTQTPSMIQNPNVTTHKIKAPELDGLKQKFGVGKQEANYNQLIDGHGTGLRAPTEQQWIEIANSAFMVESVPSSSAVQSPPSVDESTKPWFPPIGNQDGEGSCVAWAVGYYAKTFQEAKEHGWNLTGAKWEGDYAGHPTAEYQDKIVSPDFIYHLVNFGVDGGSSFYDAIQLVCFVGASSWEKMPYDPFDHTTWPSEEAWREAPLFRGSSNGYQYMQVNTDAGLANLKNLLLSGQLAIIGVDANKYSSLTSADLWTLDNYVSPSVNHANTVVGYDDTIAYNENGQLRHGAFKIANSWGVGVWEKINDGYYWISYEAMKQRISYCMFYDDLVGYTPELAATFRLSHDKRDECDITLGAGNVSSPLITKRFSNYVHGGSQPFCQNDILFDVTEFRAFVPTVYNQSYFLQVYDGGSSTTGTICKFAIENVQSNTAFLPTVNYNYVYLNVTLPPLSTFGFSLGSASPSSRIVTAGDYATYGVPVTLVSGSGSVSLSCSGLPSGATCSFNPSSGNPTFSSTLTVYTSTGTPEGTYTLTVAGTGGGQTHFATVQLVVVNSTSSTVTLYTEDPAGVPVSSAFVYLNGSLKGATDRNGYLTIIKVPSGNYVLTARKTGYLDYSTPITVPPSLTINVTMTRPPVLTVNVKDSLSGLPIPYANVYLDGEFKNVTDYYKGSCTISIALLGNHELTVNKTDYWSYSTMTNVTSDLTVNITLTKMPSLGTIIATVKDASDGYIQGAGIYLNGTFANLTDVNGRLSVQNVSTGLYRVTATKNGYDDASSSAVVYKGGTANVYLVMKRKTYSVTVNVKDSNGSAVATANVFLNGTFKGATISNGTKVISSVLPGSYTLSVKKGGYADYANNINVTSNMTINVTLTKAYILTIYVKDSSTGNTISYAEVFIDGGYVGTTDYFGKLIISGVAEGPHTLTVKKTSYLDYSVSINVTSSVTLTIPLTKA